MRLFCYYFYSTFLIFSFTNYIFCINVKNPGYNETLNILKGRLAQIENEKLMYISPEYLVGFFEELINESEK